MRLADEQRHRRLLLAAAMVVSASGCSGSQPPTDLVTEAATGSPTAVVTATPTSAATTTGDDADPATGTSADETSDAADTVPSPTASAADTAGIPLASACGVVDPDQVAAILGSPPVSRHDIAIGDEFPPQFGLPEGQISTGYHCAFRGEEVEDEVRRVPALTVSIYPAEPGSMQQRLDAVRGDDRCRLTTGTPLGDDAVVVSCGHPEPPSASEVTHIAVLGDALLLCGATVLQQHAMSLEQDMTSFCLAVAEDLAA